MYAEKKSLAKKIFPSGPVRKYGGIRAAASLPAALLLG